jgi:hypothetical protein
MKDYQHKVQIYQRSIISWTVSKAREDQWVHAELHQRWSSTSQEIILLLVELMNKILPQLISDHHKHHK